MMKFNSLKWILCAATLSYVSGCDPGIDQDPPPNTDDVLAIYNPTAKTIPLPNSAALEPDGTLPSAATAEPTALNEAFNYLGEYQGWSPKTPIKIPFSGELQVDTVTPENVSLYEVSGDKVTLLESTPTYLKNNGTLCDPKICESVIIVTPKMPLVPGHQYAVLATKGIKGANGNPVKEDAPIFFGLSKNAIYEDAEVKLNLFKDKPATAKSLEGIRRQLAPIVEALELNRDNVASLFTWTLVKNGFTVLDPASATLPIPNTLALERDGTFPSSPLHYCADISGTPACEKPNIKIVACEKKADCLDNVAHLGSGYSCISGVCKNAKCAQGEFDAYLDGLHGWPTTIPITLPVVGEIDESTLNQETVQLFEMVKGVPTKVKEYTIAMDPCGDKIVIIPKVAMGYNTKYFAFATRDIMTLSKDATGKEQRLPLLPPAEVFLGIQPHDVLIAGESCEAASAGTPCEGDKGICAPFRSADVVEFKCGKSAVTPLGVDDASAFRLHMIRPLLRGTAEVIEQVTSIKYTKLAALWSWSTWTDTFTVFDPSAASIPFPHTFLTTGCPADRPVCNIPKGEDPLSMLLYEELSRRSGFSTTAPNWIPFLGPDPKPETVNTDTILFSEVPAGGLPPLFPKDEYEASVIDHNAVLKFKRPLHKGALVAGLLTTDVKGANGFAVQPTAPFVFLRSKFKLIDKDGNSTVRQIPTKELAAQLEGARQQFKRLFLVSAVFGYKTEQISNAWAYVTQDTTKPVQELRALALANLATSGLPTITEANAKTENAPGFLNGDGTTTLEDEPSVKVDVSNLASIHWNMEYSSNWWLDDKAHITAMSLDMPKSLPLGISVFVPKTGVGCTAPFDIAIVQHGNGSYRKRIGLAYANVLAGNCIATVAIDLPLHGGRMPSGTTLHPDKTPAMSGKGFISQDFIAVKSLFMQTTADLSVLTKIIKGGGLNTILPNFSTSDSKIGYIGQSMGAFIGTSFVTIEKDIDSVVLNVGGGYFYDLLTASEAFSPLFTGLGLMPGSIGELKALHFIQWLADLIDPYAFGPYMIKAPLDEITYDGAAFGKGDTLPVNQVMMQMVVDDPVIPNSGTKLVADVIGSDLTNTTYPKGTRHGFVAGLDPSAADGGKAGVCARQQGADFLLNAFGTATTIVSATDCLK